MHLTPASFNSLWKTKMELFDVVWPLRQGEVDPSVCEVGTHTAGSFLAKTTVSPTVGS